MVFDGYEANPEANARAFRDGWFRTGDEEYMDEDGYFYVSGRIKEIIIRGGENISPCEVDEVLLSHPAVRQAVTFGRPDARLPHACGPTENTTFSTTHLVTKMAPDAVTVPIGRPTANSTACVLDAHLRPWPGYVAAVAARGEEWPVSLWEFVPADA